MLFHIEEDAYEHLRGYLRQIEANLGNSEDNQDILNDIESRIAELLKERLGENREVVTNPDIEEVIKTIGNPEEIGEAGKEDSSSKQEGRARSGYSYARKRLYRNPDSRVLGGVCGGIGAYFNTDPVIVRVIFVLAFLGFGVGLLIYLILWIVVPIAQTQAEKSEMRGEQFTFSDIGKNIKDEFQNVRNRMNF